MSVERDEPNNLARVAGESTPHEPATGDQSPPADPVTPRKDMPVLVAVTQTFGPEPPVMHACARLCDYEDMVEERDQLAKTIRSVLDLRGSFDGSELVGNLQARQMLTRALDLCGWAGKPDDARLTGFAGPIPKEAGR